MDILQKILSHKKEEIAFAKKNISLEELKDRKVYFNEKKCLKNSLNIAETNIIAEFKRKSPSKGWFAEGADPLEITKAYNDYGAAAISVLTDEYFFGGNVQDLLLVSQNVSCPVLRKDFIIGTYQLHEAKAFGADMILLIAAALSKDQVKELASEAQEIGLQVLLEIHNRQELDHICEYTEYVGVNNRDLKSFQINIKISEELSSQIPDDKIKISESGIDSVQSILQLKKSGFKGFLMGEKFMKEANPSIAFKDFANELKGHHEN